jgi:ERCC4-type nuclease
MVAGDASFEGNGPEGRVHVGFERKAVLDLVGSMTSGRLAEKQLPDLYKEFGFAWVMVEGRMRPNPTTGELQIAKRMGALNTSSEWRNHSEVVYGKQVHEARGRVVMFRDIDKFIGTLALKAGVLVWRTETMDETAQFICDMRSWFMDPWDSHKSHLAFYNPRMHTDPAMLAPPSLVRRIAAQLPLIGWEKSKFVARQFEDAYTMVNADEDEWTRIPGIGSKIASAVWRILRGIR